MKKNGSAAIGLVVPAALMPLLAMGKAETGSLRFMSFSISSSKRFSLSSTSAIASPLLPALPVLPIRWIKSSALKGSSWLITQGMSGISKPLAATSVATKASMLPLLKASRVSIRSVWLLSPWIADALIPSRSNALASRAHPSRLLVKMMHCLVCPAFTRFCKIATIAARLFSDFTKCTTWLTVSAAAFCLVTSMVTGLRK